MILNNSIPGCDFVVKINEKRKIKLLQLTDMQFIDSSQRRTPDRLRIDEINAWDPKNFDANCGNQIRTLITQTNPDLIFITGDIIYGSFDDKGTTFKWFIEFIDSFKIPWAPVFGNHDNESNMGVAWQCQQLENSEYCLFKRGNVSGNGNYTVGIAVGDKLIRVLHMIDSNGCLAYSEEGITNEKGIYADQIELFKYNSKEIELSQGRKIPAFMAFHIPIEEFREAEIAKGYRAKDSNRFYTIGVDREAKDGDFGCCYEKYKPITFENFKQFAQDCAVDGVFVGHCHAINTCINHNGIKYVFGLKTGQYDYHNPGQLGGTLVTLEGESFDVSHIPALAMYAPMPGGASFFNNFFAEDKYIVE